MDALEMIIRQLNGQQGMDPFQSLLGGVGGVGSIGGSLGNPQYLTPPQQQQKQAPPKPAVNRKTLLLLKG